MAYENIGSYIAQNTRKTFFMWILFFILNTGLFFYYSYENERQIFMNTQILNLSEINAEATTLLYYNSQKEKSSEVDFNKTMLNSWNNTESMRFQELIKTARPEIELLKNLGKEFYDSSTKTQSEQILKYQKFSDQIDLIKRLSKNFIDHSPTKLITQVLVPVSIGLFLILLFFTFSFSGKLKKNIINKNAIILEDMWKELKSLESDSNFSSGNQTVSHQFTYIQNQVSVIIEETKLFRTQSSVIKNSLTSYIQNASLTVESTESHDGFNQELTEKLNYIQKLLSRLFTRAERASTLAQATSDNGFQAGILALNISIEAARAGDAGKSFLIVSDKVKDFAEKSSHIGGSIIEELKDADISIRKAYAVGKSILENKNLETNKSSTALIPATDQIALENTVQSFEKLQNMSTKIQTLLTELEEQILDYTHLTSNNATNRNLEFMKDVMIRSFERLYRLSYGIDPPVNMKSTDFTVHINEDEY